METSARINVAKKFKFVLKGVEGIVDKGENAVYQHFTLFYDVFKRPLSQGC